MLWAMSHPAISMVSKGLDDPINTTKSHAQKSKLK